MEESKRRRRSLWDTEDDRKHSSRAGKEYYLKNDGDYHKKFHSGDDNNPLRPKHISGWPSWEPEVDMVSQKNDSIYEDSQNASKMKDQGGKYSSHYKSISPGFDDWGQRQRNLSPDDGVGHAHRYPEGYSSRSRSRSRDRGRSRGRSRSRGRINDRGSGWRKSRSRSRIRSRSRSRSGNRPMASTRIRSRSPFHDRNRESYGWSDRSVSGVSSLTCRDFAAGNCRRGSQCRFVHSDMDGEFSERDLQERSRSRVEREHTGRYLSEGPGFQSGKKASNMNYGEDESFRTTRGTNCCKDFMRGKCKWGASCRFSHHVSSGDNDQGTRNVPFDRDRGQDQSRKTPCKFFLAGKCHRDNCRFSHERPTSGSHEGRLNDENDGRNVAVKNEGWNGPTWGEVEKAPKFLKATGWGDGSTADYTVPVEGMDNPWDHNGRTSWGSQSNEKASGTDKCPSPPKWTDQYENTGVRRSTSIEDLNDWHQNHLASQGLQSQAEIFPESDIQQHQEVVEGNVVKAFSFEGDEGIKATRKTADPPHVTGQSLNQNGVGSLLPTHSLVPNDQRDNSMFPMPSNDRHIDLNGPAQVRRSSLDFHSQTQSHHDEAAQAQELQKSAGPQSRQSNASSDQVTQIVRQAASLTHELVNEQLQPHLQIALNSTSELALSAESCVPPIKLAYVQPNSVVGPQDDYNPLGNSIETSTRGISSQPSVNLPYSLEQQNEMTLEEFTPPHPAIPESGTILQSGSSRMLYNEGLNSKRLETAAYSFEQQNQMTLEQFTPPRSSNPQTGATLQSGSSRVLYHESTNSKQLGITAYSVEHQNQMTLEQFTPPRPVNPETGTTLQSGSSMVLHHESPNQKQVDTFAVSEVKKDKNNAAEHKQGQGDTHKENVNRNGKVEEVTIVKDDKEIRLFKNALVEFVKEILKPRWKEGKMSREVHKTVVKKVVDKVTSTIQGDHVPKTQDRIEQYLSYSKAKISKLVEAYVERHLKTDS